ncbi:MgtC/SapB family protein [Acidomonas methanolica]|uniref:Protein MgtC n=1 Tax=Acidomonas methanolica NBRC 104435 TaxID=1231351 RepID=A0A023D3G8_ACIMT|nr:MgtC/SapB family protein [Acidomonas methanolica]MBU2653947.1 MgtC/SapB family protein [Acidomonas methanolica]MCQ9155297.1 MgtC/SapB family protein [Acidomonas methanolica]TCS30908.1 putative Mg2+ transporter-C (MgtC) family protein [Acidomonas methanolica]GAJ28683.1 Mg(2+) transport ATPase protein C [Acidomonas methanolica NBRC 104435]GBQ53757.1 MgtC/SapB transporter [Acidomonas methanolica]
MRFIETFDPHSFADSCVSLFTALLFGTLIGAERQYRQRTAGVRTNALVALGGAAFVDLAQRLAGDVESLRVIAYVVSGIGFLGAGAIIKEGVNVRGMNTAATLWCSAAVGACTGSDMVAEATLLTFFVIAGNTLLRPVVRFINRLPVQTKTMDSGYLITATVTRDAALRIAALVETTMRQHGHQVERSSITTRDEMDCTLRTTLLPREGGPAGLDRLLAMLIADDAVKEADWRLNADG